MNAIAKAWQAVISFWQRLKKELTEPSTDEEWDDEHIW